MGEWMMFPLLVSESRHKKKYTPHSHVIPLLFSYPSNDIGWCPIVVQVSFEAQ